MEFSTPKQDLGSLKNNVALNAFRIAINGSLTGPQKYDDGFLDEFEDESGVDTGSCVGQSYDAGNDLYKKQAGTTDVCSGGTAISGGDGNPKENAFDNDTGVMWTSSQVEPGINGVAYIGYDFGAGNEKMVDVFRIWQLGGGGNHITSAKIQFSDNGSDWSDLETVTFTTAGGAWEQENLTNTTESHRYWRCLANSGVGGGAWGVYEIEMFAPASGFTLISNNITAESNDPVKARIILLVDYNGASPTLNTDINAFLSIDNGSTFDTVVLEDAGLYDTDKHIIIGEVTVTPRGDKEVVVKIVTGNQKDVYLEAWSVFWEY